jgi:deoxyribonuclease V
MIPSSPIHDHPWKVSQREAKRIQEELSFLVITEDDFEKIATVLGVGVVFSAKQDEALVGCVSFSFPELKIQKTAFHRQKINFPYTPGFFAFSAGPAIVSAVKEMERPDLLMLPGRGIAHPRGLGLASHLGVLLDLPTVACSKTPLWRNLPEPSANKGAHLFVKGEDKSSIGAVVRTREGKKPVYVTPGHKISVKTAVKIALQCSPTYRIPEPLRQAHTLANRARTSS